MSGNSKHNYWRIGLAIAVPCLLGWSYTALAMYHFKDYLWGLFVWMPLVLAALTSILYGYRNSVNRKGLRNLSYVTLAVFSIGLLSFAMEGLICIAMAAPVGILFTYIGHWVGYAIIKRRSTVGPPMAMLILSLSVPALMAFEHSSKEEDDLRVIKTAIEIDAPMTTVWECVIHFTPIDKPKSLIFNSGIAYPISARISGTGVGAIRRCNFSTGSFVEPITGWSEPTLLQFNVDEQPEPLKEISVYDIHPNHLHGYWISKKGQFKLSILPNGRTLLEGTTWYVNKIKPGIYWTVWSDYIVHQIHNRVLDHVKDDAMRLQDHSRKLLR